MTAIIHDPRYNWEKTKEIKSWNVHREMMFLYMMTELGLLGEEFSYLEVGTFEGASAAWMLTNTQAYVATIDINEEGLLLEHIATALGCELRRLEEPIDHEVYKIPFRLEQRFDFYQGDSTKVLPALIEDDGTKFDLIYIDGNHSYEFAREDIRNAEKLLSSGGVLAIDDYAEMAWCEVYDAVNEWLTDDWEILLDRYVLWLRKK